MKYIKDNWKFFVFMIVMCIIGAYFTTIYSLQTVDQKVLDEAIKQVGSKDMVIAITVIQTIIYGIMFAGLGLILSNKVGLWKKFKKDKDAIKWTTIIAIVGGLLLIGDRYIFGPFIEQVRQSYEVKPSIEYIIASFTYGGVFEEILMRLFLMSLFAWIIAKIFYKKEKKIPVKVFVIANIITALLFAAGHLPSTIQLFGSLTPLIVFRCFLMNGAFGLAVGWLYRKYSIHYSMLAHFGAHLVSKVIWILFI